MDSAFWNKIYNEKSDSEMSWFQEIPKASLDLIREFNLPPESKIIDIGGGDSRFVDHLLGLGFSQLSVLDISEEALERAKTRLANKSNLVEWIISDVRQFVPTTSYDLWHDRATFHFLIDNESVEQYLRVAHKALKMSGSLIISTFSKNGPKKCSGLSVQNYSQDELKATFNKYFTNVKCLETSHKTPWGTTQDFIFCGFKKI